MAKLLQLRSTMFRTIHQAFIGSSLITAVVTGIIVAFVQEKWVFVPVVALSIGITLFAILRQWQTRPYAGEVQRILSDRSIVLRAFLFLGSLFVQGIAIASMGLTYSQVHEQVLICLSPACGRDYIDLVVIAGAGSYMETVGLCASILAIYGIIRKLT